MGPNPGFGFAYVTSALYVPWLPMPKRGTTAVPTSGDCCVKQKKGMPGTQLSVSQ